MKKLFWVGALALTVGGSAGRPLLASPQLADAPLANSSIVAQATAPTSQAEVLVLETGAAPRQALRLQLAPGMEQTAQSTLRMKMSGSFNGQAIPPMNLPGMNFGMIMKVDKVDANGDSHVTFGYTGADVVASPEVPEPMVEAMRSQLQGLLDYKGKIVVSDQGQTKQFQVELPKNLDAASRQTLDGMLEQLTTSLQQMSAPLPNEPVGVGAKWQAPPQTLTINGMTVTQTATYELVEWQDKAMKLAVTFEQTASPQTINFPGMPPGASLRLQSLKALGSGTVTMRLDRLFPSQASIQVNSNAAMQAQDPALNEPANMLMNSAIEMTLESN